MHGSVLQNDDYIKFARENTVEVISLGRLKEGVDKEDKKAAQYDAEDEAGQPVKYMVEFPGLTLEEMYALNTSKAGTYNDTGKIPYTAIVDPHTGEQLKALPGGRAAGQLMEAVEEQKKVLNEKYGPSLSRSVLESVNECKKECSEIAADKGAGKALVQFEKDTKKLAKEGDKIVAMLDEIKATLLTKAGEELDAADALIDEGDFGGAKKILSSLSSPLKKTDLGSRVSELYEKIKTKQAEAGGK
jgi:hypothetical protein